MQDTYKIPRLYIDAPLGLERTLSFNADQTHYLKNVMRRGASDPIRVFNGRDGEFLARIEDLQKKSAAARCERLLRAQEAHAPRVHLLFAPLKKHRMDQIIEKTVELGVTDLHPVLTHRTEIRTMKEDKVQAQIIEAAEQSERLDIPRLHPLTPLKQKIAAWPEPTPIFWGAEGDKDEAPPLSQALHASAFLIGPVGGFDEEECTFLKKQPLIRPTSLGPRVLRAETACLYCMVLANPKTA